MMYFALQNSLYKHPLTTESVKALCEDLKVLGKKDFKELMKWREVIRLALGLILTILVLFTHVLKNAWYLFS